MIHFFFFQMKPDVEIPSSLCRAQLTEYPPTLLFTPASKVTKCREEMLKEIVFPMDCGQDKLPVVQVLIWLSIVAFKSKLHQLLFHCIGHSKCSPREGEKR